MENDLQWIIYVLERAYLGNDTLPGNAEEKVVETRISTKNWPHKKVLNICFLELLNDS